MKIPKAVERLLARLFPTVTTGGRLKRGAAILTRTCCFNDDRALEGASTMIGPLVFGWNNLQLPNSILFSPDPCAELRKIYAGVRTGTQILVVIVGVHGYDASALQDVIEVAPPEVFHVVVVSKNDRALSELSGLPNCNVILPGEPVNNDTFYRGLRGWRFAA